MIQIIDSITSLVNGASCVVKDNSEIIWTDSRPQPTDAEIQTEVTRLQAEYDAQSYARSRQAEYPSIEECVHAILDDDLDTLQVKRQAVKDKYPKG